MASADRARAEARRIVHLRRGEGRVHLVFAPDVGGNVLYARSLVAALPAGIDAYALPLTGEMIGAQRTITLELMAESFAKVLAQTVPEGPLHVAGFSFAGFVAFETARALERSGRPVERIWLFDARADRISATRSLLSNPGLEARHALRYLRRHWRRMLGLDPAPDLLRGFRRIELDLSTRPEAYRQLIRALYDALGSYRPRPWPGAPVTLFRAVGVAEDTRWPRDLGWRRLTRGAVEIIDLPAGHLEIMEAPDSVGPMAGAMTERMSGARNG